MIRTSVRSTHFTTCEQRLNVNYFRFNKVQGQFMSSTRLVRGMRYATKWPTGSTQSISPFSNVRAASPSRSPSSLYACVRLPQIDSHKIRNRFDHLHFSTDKIDWSERSRATVTPKSFNFKRIQYSCVAKVTKAPASQSIQTKTGFRLNVQSAICLVCVVFNPIYMHANAI